MHPFVLGQSSFCVSNDLSRVTLFCNQTRNTAELPTSPYTRSRSALVAVLTVLLSIGAVMGMLSQPAYGQSTSAAISGTIADPSGAVIPNASITVRNNPHWQTLADASEAR